MNPFLKPFTCHWVMLDNVHVCKAGNVRIEMQAHPLTFTYCAPPCERKWISTAQIDHYLQEIKLKLSIEYFVLDNQVNLRQNYTREGKILNPDIFNGQKNVPISVVNEVHKELQ